ncbi:WXG100 family type VII secretion target [Bogoriella caseilytica]|uniref:ESAT-6-like protein n=1 Tax=Bogoriella caseilytica TaxID=56055 RepID=A0A3N2BDE7_9MICO|nr:WXG100 family type VII secretion target [Bogoriella caseilytica]ROR73268.1 WXG100 family type VII secretion target [Bogoriella caseilytica]
MTQFTVDSGEILIAADRTRATATAIRGEVAAMMGHLTALQASWRGTASQTFDACAAQWQATQATVDTSLEQISHALDNAARMYEETETAARSMFGT